MSKKELLTNDEMIHARTRGWVPVNVYDLATTKWLVKLFTPHDATPPDLVAQHVLEHARMGDKVAIKSLQLLTGAT